MVLHCKVLVYLSSTLLDNKVLGTRNSWLPLQNMPSDHLERKPVYA